MTIYTVTDRGFDRGKHRFCIVAPVGAFAIGERIRCNEHGLLPCDHIGRPYMRDGETVCNYYLAVTAEDIGAPTDHLTPEQAAYRAQRKTAQTAGFARYLATTTPAERAAKSRAGWYAKTPEERRAIRDRCRAGAREFWRIMRADPETLTEDELRRRQKHARKPRTLEQRARIAAGTKRGKAAAKAGKKAAKFAQDHDTPRAQSVQLEVFEHAASGRWYVRKVGTDTLRGEPMGYPSETAANAAAQRLQGGGT